MTNPFPKGALSVELFPNFPFFVLEKAVVITICSVFITPPQILTCIKLLSRRSMLTSPRLVCLSGAEWQDRNSKQFFFPKYKGIQYKHEITVLLLECCLENKSETTVKCSYYLHDKHIRTLSSLILYYYIISLVTVRLASFGVGKPKKTSRNYHEWKSCPGTWGL